MRLPASRTSRSSSLTPVDQSYDSEDSVIREPPYGSRKLRSYFVASVDDYAQSEEQHNGYASDTELFSSIGSLRYLNQLKTGTMRLFSKNPGKDSSQNREQSTSNIRSFFTDHKNRLFSKTKTQRKALTNNGTPKETFEEIDSASVSGSLSPSMKSFQEQVGLLDQLTSAWDKPLDFSHRLSLPRNDAALTKLDRPPSYYVNNNGNYDQEQIKESSVDRQENFWGIRRSPRIVRFREPGVPKIGKPDNVLSSDKLEVCVISGMNDGAPDNPCYLSLSRHKVA